MKTKQSPIRIVAPQANARLNSLRRATTALTCIYTLILCGLPWPSPAVAEGTWISLQQPAPEGIGTMLLLSDGTVMAQAGNVANPRWYRLAPDATGGYTNGAWSARTSMNYSRLYYASDVLQDGRVFIAGAEYGNGTTNAEVYSPYSDS